MQRPEVRTQSGSQYKIMIVFSSQNYVLTRCRCVVCPTPRVYTHAYERRRTHVKGPEVHVRVRWITETRKHCTQKNNNWLAPFYGCSLSPGKATRMSRALHWDKKSNQSKGMTKSLGRSRGNRRKPHLGVICSIYCCGLVHVVGRLFYHKLTVHSPLRTYTGL